MALKVNTSLDNYKYGIDVAVAGVPEQPYAINFFIKDKEFTELSLIPQIYKRHESFLTSMVAAIDTCQQTKEKSKKMSQKVINDNLANATLALTVPFGNRIKNWLQKEKYHYTDVILNTLKDKQVIAGIAIEGTVVKTFAPDLLDTLTEDTANLNHARRLLLLSALIKSSLQTMTHEFELSKEPLAPVVDVVVATITTLTDAVKSSERDIKEIKKRVTRLQENKNNLTAQTLVDLNTVNKHIRTIISDQLKVIKTASVAK